MLCYGIYENSNFKNKHKFEKAKSTQKTIEKKCSSDGKLNHLFKKPHNQHQQFAGPVR